MHIPKILLLLLFMTRGHSVRIKAMLLTIVFLLNTVIGFACSIGIDMGFNSAHLKHEHAVAKHEHSNQSQQDHHPHKAHHNQNADSDNCCKDEAAKLTASDKLTQRIFDLHQLSLPFAVLAGHVFFQRIELGLPSNVPNACFAKHCRSPIIDVRIAIQSFQI